MMSIIQEYSNHLEEIFENSFDYIYLHDKEGNILDVNNVVVQNLGYSKNEILNMKVTDFLLEEVPSIISDEIKKTMETGVANKPRTYKVRKKDSTFIYVEASAILLKKNDDPYAILEIGHDVTAYKEVEQNLRESEERFRRIFETIPDLFFLISSDTTILDYKGNVEDFFVPPEKIINRKISEIVPEDIAALSSNSIKKTIETHEPQIVEFKLLNEGIYRNFEARHLYFSQDRVLVFIREITYRKRSEQKLKESNAKFKKIIENINDIIIIVGFDGKPIYTSPNYKELIGRSPDFQNPEFNFVHKEDREGLFELYKNAIQNKEVSGTQNLEYRIMTGSGGEGNYLWLDSRTYNYIDENGDIIGFITSLRDITEKKKAEQKFKEKNLELSVLNRIITLGNESTSLQEFLEKSYNQVLDIGSFDRGGVYLYNPETQHNILVLHKNVHPNFIAAVEDVDISEGLFAKVFDKNKPFYIEDFSDFLEGSKELGIYSAAIIPLRSKDEYVGSMNIGSSVHQVLSQNELELLVAIGKQMGIIIQKFESEKLLKESEEKFRKLSYELEEIVNERTKELKQSEEKYRDLFTGMSNGVAVYETLDEGNTFIFKDMNPAGEKISGVKKDEIIGKNVAEIFPRVKDAGLLDTLKTVYKTNTPIRHPIAFYGDETISRWAENYVYKLPTGEIVAVYDDLTALKITEQKLKQLNEGLEQKVNERTKELKESEEKFRTIAEQSFMGIIILQDGVFKYYNKQAAEINGYTAEEIQNWKPYEFQKLIYPEDREYVIDQAQKKQKGDPDVITHYQYRVVKKSGEVIWVDNYSKTINFKGKPADFVMTIDINDKIKAEQQLKESEEKFRNIAEQSFMGIIIIQNGQLKYLNKAMANISGHTVEEMLNWSEKDMAKMIYPEELENVLNRLQSNIEGKMGPYSSNSFRLINRNGEVRWLEDYTTRILYEGKLANLISLVDITDKKEAEQLIIEENKRLIELYELRKDLITRVSHELKTPMTSIYGANQILIKLYMEEIGEEAQKYIEIGHRGSLRLKQLIDNLLDVSRLDSKKFELRLQKENLVELIVDCVKDMNYLAFNRQLKMKLELPNEVYLDIDRLRFRQVLTNIISNAIKNTPSGGEIHIDLIEQADNIDIHVIDTGVGLIEKEMEKLFEKFGKIERYGMDLGVDIEGSGLGLYISKEIMELHGGQIFVESEGRNKGATFTLRLFKT